MSENKIRLAKVMAQAGVCSRRMAEQKILDGDVMVNGVTANEVTTFVGPDDSVKVDGCLIAAEEAPRLWLYYKPPGVMTTHYDPEGRPTAFEDLPKDLPRVMSVGRLDLNSEGLLLLTNNGRLQRYFEHPINAFKRSYRVQLFGRLAALMDLDVSNGLNVEGERLRPFTVKHLKSDNNTKRHWVIFTLFEGKNREIRRICDHIFMRVLKLIRIEYGPYELGDLEPDDVREVKIAPEILEAIAKPCQNKK